MSIKKDTKETNQLDILIDTFVHVPVVSTPHVMMQSPPELKMSSGPGDSGEISATTKEDKNSKET